MPPALDRDADGALEGDGEGGPAMALVRLGTRRTFEHQHGGGMVGAVPSMVGVVPSIAEARRRQDLSPSRAVQGVAPVADPVLLLLLLWGHGSRVSRNLWL